MPKELSSKPKTIDTPQSATSGRTDSISNKSTASRASFKRNLTILLPEDEPGTDYNPNFKTPQDHLGSQVVLTQSSVDDGKRGSLLSDASSEDLRETNIQQVKSDFASGSESKQVYEGEDQPVRESSL